MEIPADSKILVIRNDKLGDFTLSLPAFALLKTCMPTTEIHALVPEYTRPIAEACPYIDHIVLDPGKSGSSPEQKLLLSTIRKQHYSAALTLYSTTRIGWILMRAHIPDRIAPATKLAQIFHNHRIRQRRSQSFKPEYEYNLDLARYLLTLYTSSCADTPTPPYIHFDESEINSLKQQFLTHYKVAKEKRLVFIHPGSGGSANNLDPGQYALLARKLAQNKSLHVVISAGPGEYEVAHAMSSQLGNGSHCVYESKDGLEQFAKHIAFADLFISGSTGPLHVAGALNRPTVGFYTNRQSATSLRWQTLSTDDRRLAFSPPAGAEAEDMSRVDLGNALTEIEAMLARLYLVTTATNP